MMAQKHFFLTKVKNVFQFRKHLTKHYESKILMKSLIQKNSNLYLMIN